MLTYAKPKSWDSEEVKAGKAECVPLLEAAGAEEVSQHQPHHQARTDHLRAYSYKRHAGPHTHTHTYTHPLAGAALSWSSTHRSVNRTTSQSDLASHGLIATEIGPSTNTTTELAQGVTEQCGASCTSTSTLHTTEGRWAEERGAMVTASV